MDVDITKKENLLSQIFCDNWDNFKTKYPGYATSHYDEIVEKMLNFGDPKFGYTEYGCMYCGNGRHLVAFTCKSCLCLRCGRVKSENFVYQVMNKLHEGVVYRHLILTMPDQLKQFFYDRRHDKELYNELYRCGYEYIQDVFETVTGRRLRCGAIIVLHVTGRKGNYRVHLHIIVMNGGIDVVTGEWVNIGHFPYEKILPKKWQWHLLNMIKDFDDSDETKRLVSFLWKKYKNGFYNNFKKGDVPKRSQHLVKYLAKYLFRPMISLKRILNYDSDQGLVKYEYADHKTGKSEIEEISVYHFIGRLMQQVLPKGFHRVKYYGLHHQNSYSKWEQIVQEGIASQVDSELLSRDYSVFKVAADTYQSRMKLWTGKDPLACPHCGHQMEVVKVWSRDKGVIFDLLEKYKRNGRSPPEELFSIKNVIPTEPIDIVETVYEQMEMPLF